MQFFFCLKRPNRKEKSLDIGKLISSGLFPTICLCWKNRRSDGQRSFDNKVTCHVGGSSSVISPVGFTCDASISLNVSVRHLCASEDGRDISINFLLMLMLMFSEDIVDLSIKCSLIG